MSIPAEGFAKVQNLIKQWFCIEWLDPLMTAGNLVPELAKIANAETPGAKAGAHSPWLEWEELKQMNPDVICIIPCGYSIEQTPSERYFEIIIKRSCHNTGRRN